MQTLWFCVLAFMAGGYAVLDGFDLGVGILHLWLGRNEDERRTAILAIGPVWDGNEVWLVVAGGATFAAFPAWYATMFSGFYLALLLILVLLIVRVVSFEWRDKRDSPRWRATWQWANTIGSVGAPFIWGVALANLIMIGGVWQADGAPDASWLWLLAYFTVLTIGELYLSPVGLSLVSKVAPTLMVSMMMGVWLATSFIGGFLAGWLGSFWSRMEKPEFFLMIAAIAACAGAAIFAFRWFLRGALPD